jgi:predicted RNA-binding protein with TRAM domain
VEEGKEYEVLISEISRKRDGIARVQRFVIFVRGASLGQKARVRITSVGARFATAEIVTKGEATLTGRESQEPAGSDSQLGPQTPEEEKPKLQDY